MSHPVLPLWVLAATNEPFENLRASSNFVCRLLNGGVIVNVFVRVILPVDVGGDLVDVPRLITLPNGIRYLVQWVRIL